MDHIFSELSTVTCPSWVALYAAAAAATNGSPPGSPVPGILQARTLALHGMVHIIIELDTAVLHWSGGCEVLE